MLSTFNSLEKTIAALDTDEMIFAFRILLQMRHPYLYHYLWQHGYYREEAEAILQCKTTFLDNRVFRKLQNFAVSDLFALLTLMGQAKQEDVRKFLLWRQTLPKALYTVYTIDYQAGSSLLISLITNFGESEFFTLGTSPSIIESYEPLLRLKPDIVVVSHTLAGVDGLEGITLLKPLLPDTAFLLRSMRFHPTDFCEMLETAKKAGVDNIDYCYAPLPTELLPTLRKTIENFHQGIQIY